MSEHHWPLARLSALWECYILLKRPMSNNEYLTAPDWRSYAVMLGRTDPIPDHINPNRRSLL